VTVVVGYRAGKVGLSGLHVAVRVARTLEMPLTVATIVPKPWLTPSLARVDAEYEHWADHLAAESATEATGTPRLRGHANVAMKAECHASVAVRRNSATA
jgi:hypothetical protein